jgi:hypothetical protein
VYGRLAFCRSTRRNTQADNRQYVEIQHGL